MNYRRFRGTPALKALKPPNLHFYVREVPVSSLTIITA
eukprot:CAMPEP_0184687868 /NCGR_PEP_ID=MMETSP0312-20130426/27823_1 /TAXON_ID=31354 /ORGANISM="Compsopogon coeruleus, Strain SAG 36.94" /LENGTH=37 /DNA_ID= /DNA_START= /DNA_END= /DNA_ORIENTATION=